MPTDVLDRHDTDLIERGRAEVKSINAQLDEITKSGWQDDDGNMHVKPEALTEFKALLTKAEDIHTFTTGLESKGRMDAWLDAPATNSVIAHAAAAGSMVGMQPAEYKSLGQMFVESEEFKSHRDSGFMDRAFIVEDREITSGVQYKDVHSGSIGVVTHPGFGTVHRAPMVHSPMLTWRVRDLFPQMNTNSVMIEYIEELGFVDTADNAAAPVPERDGDNFGLKPKSNIRFDIKTTPIRTLAHWVPASRNVLDDEPQLRGIIDTRLLYGLRLVEDEQLLLGDGTGQNLLGIFNTPGIQLFPSGAYTPPTHETYVDAIRRAATRVMLAQYDPTGIVVHPYDWERMELTKNAQGDYIVAGSVISGAEKRLWQMPVVATPACPEGTALLGAFGLGAQVFDRMQSNIRTADQHADFFIRNAIVVLAEERLGLAVYRPASMVKVDLVNATT